MFDKYLYINQPEKSMYYVYMYFKFVHLFTYSIHLNFEMNSTHYKKGIIVFLSERIFDYSW